MEQRLIDADAIKLEKGFFEKVDNVPKFYEWLGKQPTVDAVPVTHCVDCKHSKQVNGRVNGQVVKLVWCDHLAEVGAWVENDFYCADGERRSDGQTEDIP